MKNKNFVLRTGTSDFRKLISSDELIVDPNYLFVDKTIFIKDFLENNAEALLITRPRRWGKSLALSMLRYFLEKEVDGKPTAGLFKTLKIAEHITSGSILEKFQGNYPVIMISFKDIKGSNIQTIIKELTFKISELFEANSYILKKTEINIDDIARFNLIMKGTEDFSLLTISIKFLSKLLFEYSGKKVFILIDEYDNPINHNYDKPEILKWLTEFFSALFGNCLKDNPCLEKGLITGILRVAKANVFSGLNNISEISILSEEFSQSYGFTEGETFELLKKAGLNNFDEIKSWYNGYLVGHGKVYNPWSITQCIEKNGLLDTYWVNTASPTMMKNLLLNNSKSSERIKIGDLLRKEELFLPQPLSSSISMEDIILNPSSLWSLLLHTGYLTLVESGNKNKVMLPNREVSQIIKSYLQNWFTENSMLSDVANSLLTGNIEAFREAMTEALNNPIYSSRIFNNKSSNSENNISLKEFMYQFLVMAELRCINDGASDIYEVVAEAEPANISFGQTRPDFIIVHHKHKFCIVGEIKTLLRKETLEAAATRALAQIDKNKYGKKYEEEGYHLIKLGISFSGIEFEIDWKE
jgi:hypothetical protein